MLDHKDWVDYVGSPEEMACTIIDLINELAAARAVVEAARKLGAGFTDDVSWLKATRRAIKAYDRSCGKDKLK